MKVGSTGVDAGVDAVTTTRCAGMGRKCIYCPRPAQLLPGEKRRDAQYRTGPNEEHVSICAEHLQELGLTKEDVLPWGTEHERKQKVREQKAVDKQPLLSLHGMPSTGDRNWWAPGFNFDNVYSQDRAINTRVNTQTLCDVPGVVACLPAATLQQFPRAQVVLDEEKRNAMQKSPLDMVTPGSALDVRCRLLGRTVVTDPDWEEQLAFASKFCTAFGIHVGPAVGMQETGALSDWHQHPNGVLNLCTAQEQETEKIWDFATSRPNLTAATGEGQPPPDVPIWRLKQRRGEVMWIPPFTWHRVLTVGHDVIMRDGKRILVAPHWVCWCTPICMRPLMVALFACNAGNEGQRGIPLKNDAATRMKMLEIAYTPMLRITGDKCDAGPLPRGKETGTEENGGRGMMVHGKNGGGKKRAR